MDHIHILENGIDKLEANNNYLIFHIMINWLLSMFVYIYTFVALRYIREKGQAGASRRVKTVLSINYIFIKEEGTEQEPVAEKRRCYCDMIWYDMCVCNGGRGWAGASRREKTVLIIIAIYIME